MTKMELKKTIEQMTIVEKCSLLSGESVFETRGYKKYEIPSLFLSDGPHGLRKQVGSSDHLGLNESNKSTCFPTAVALASSWDEGLCNDVGVALGAEARSLGVDVVLGPGLNIKRSPLCGRNFEYFSEDPYLAGKLAKSMIEGIQSNCVSACPKHFAANSQEYLRMLSDSVLDERALHEIYLTGFEIAVKEGNPKFVMSSYNKVNGTFANENSYLLNDVLRNRWGFKGVVVSDWGGSNSHTDAVVAGSHLEMPSAGLESIRELVSAVDNGKLSLEILNKRVEEYVNVAREIKKSQNGCTEFDVKKHDDIARKACEESMILLKNNNDILPLKDGERIGVVGEFAKLPRYQGAGSSIVNPTKITSFLDACNEDNFTIYGYECGYTRQDKNRKKNLENAVALAGKVDKVLLFIGLEEIRESEGYDRNSSLISQKQIDIIRAIEKVNKNIVCIIMAGSVIKTDFEGLCKSILHTNLTGQCGGKAILNVLTGKVCPSGKLAETYPIDVSDASCSKYFPGIERTAEYRESIFVGYRYYDIAKKAVAYPFGFGLSYTTFEYANLEISKNEVSFDLTNSGKCDGKEVVQLYISKNKSAIFRAISELKGFAKVALKAGETKRVTILLDDKAFRYYDVKSHQFNVERGKYKIMVGASSRDIKLSGELEVAGTDAENIYNKAELENYYLGNVKDISDTEFEALLGNKIPKMKWDTTQNITRNDCLSQMCYAKSCLARFAYRRLINAKKRSEKKGKPNLNIHFLLHMPFRGIAKNSGGLATLEMTDAVLEIVNGHFFKGFKDLVRAYFSKGKKDKQTQILIDASKNEKKQ